MLSIMLSYPENMKKAEEMTKNCAYFYLMDILDALGEGSGHPECWVIKAKLKGGLAKFIHTKRFADVDSMTPLTRKGVIFHDNGLEVSFPEITGVSMHGQMYDVVVYGHEGGIMNVRTAPKMFSNEAFTPRNSGRYRAYTLTTGTGTLNELRESLGYPRIECGDKIGYECDYRVIDSNIAVTKVRTFGNPVNTVKLEFNDGTSSTAVCSENDEFNLDIGIGLCIAKRVIGPDFLNAIARAKKLYVRQHKAEEKEKNRRIEERALEKRRREKAAKRRAKREEKRIKREAAIMAEAMKLAEIREKNSDYNSEQKLD